ncbi:RNA-binding protein 25 [Pelomyxa schiedti]|nr:RNA-binding protein 25 [Pelomyxa schiedti]
MSASSESSSPSHNGLPYTSTSPPPSSSPRSSNVIIKAAVPSPMAPLIHKQQQEQQQMLQAQQQMGMGLMPTPGGGSGAMMGLGGAQGGAAFPLLPSGMPMPQGFGMMPMPMGMMGPMGMPMGMMGGIPMGMMGMHMMMPMPGMGRGGPGGIPPPPPPPVPPPPPPSIPPPPPTPAISAIMGSSGGGSSSTPLVISVVSAPPVPVDNLNQPITVYVGKIAQNLEDDFMRTLLEHCGAVRTWRRVVDPLSGQMKCFGFCEFGHASGAVIALKLLNGLEVSGSNLLLKADEKNRALLEEYVARPKDKATVDSENSTEEKIKQKITALVAERARRIETSNTNKQAAAHLEKELTEARSSGENIRSGPPSTEIDKDQLVSREIQAFRERAKRETKTSRPDGEKEEGERDASDHEHGHARDRDRRDRDRDRDRYRDRDRDRDRYSRHHTRQSDRDRRSDHRSHDDTREEKPSKESSAPDKTASATTTTTTTKTPTATATTETTKSPTPDEQSVRNQLQQKARSGDYGSFATPEVTEFRKGLGFTLGAATVPAKRMKPVAGFTDDVDYDAALSGPVTKRKRELIRLDDSIVPPSQGDALKQLINSIPTDKEGLVKYTINWALVDQFQIIDKRIKPWVSKKIVEFLGEEEETFMQFVTSKLEEHIALESLLDQLTNVLEDEAEMFVIKLWRMLIFEYLRASQA